MFNQIRFSHILLGIYQIAGGMLGIAVAIGLLNRNPDPFNWALILILSWVGILYSFSIYCGVLLIIGNSRGLHLSQINQYLQVFSIFAYGFSFQYYSGAYLSVGVYLTHPNHFTSDRGLSTFRMYLDSKNYSVLFNLNLVALGLIIFIDKLRSKARTRRISNQQRKLKKTA